MGRGQVWWWWSGAWSTQWALAGLTRAWGGAYIPRSHGPGGGGGPSVAVGAARERRRHLWMLLISLHPSGRSIVIKE